MRFFTSFVDKDYIGILESVQIDFSIHELKIYSKGILICSEKIFNVVA